MHRFKLLALEVHAVRIPADGHVRVGDRELIGDAGTWVVTGHDGGVTVWSDADFRAKFEPADEAAKAYLSRA